MSTLLFNVSHHYQNFASYSFSAPCLTSPTDPTTSDVDSELQRSMRNVMKLRRGLNLPVSGEQNNKEQLEQIIRRMDKEIQTLSDEVARSGTFFIDSLNLTVQLRKRASPAPLTARRRRQRKRTGACFAPIRESISRSSGSR